MPVFVTQGTLLVYVDNSLGNITTDEQASIDDMIVNDNTQLNPYGLTLVEVSADQAANANITIMVSDTTPIGGAAQGVLGATLMDGAIILVSGWNWYTGADPGGIGSGQYDFETAVAHELGHGIGLSHSPDTTSVMYPMLATDQARRALSANDLTLIGDSEPGPEPLLAAPITTGLGAAPQAVAGVMPTTTAAAAPATTVAQSSVLSAPVVANHTVTTPVTTIGSTFKVAVGPRASSGSAPALGRAVNSSPVGLMGQPSAGATTLPMTTGLLVQPAAWAAIQPVVSSPIASGHPVVVAASDRVNPAALLPASHRMGLVPDSVLDELAIDSALWRQQGWDGTVTIPVLPPDSSSGTAVPTDPTARPGQEGSPAAFSERLAMLELAVGLWGGARVVNARKRRSGSPSLLERSPVQPRPRRD